ncbi:MAG: hypothetical protein M0Z48_00145 [Nitrospiraceae bacterium]|nr:hypothetical protein [Nitrospiraceae bacterium]
MPKNARLMLRQSIILFLFVGLAVFLRSSSSNAQKVNRWAPMEQRVRIWDEVAARQLGLHLPLPTPRPYTVSANGLEATFEKDGVKWTIIGANAPIVNATVYPKNWPVKGNGFEVLVIPEPITNYRILPFTGEIGDAVKSGVIAVTAAKGSYEPASLVIRSGGSDIKGVMIRATDLEAKVADRRGNIRTSTIPGKDIDIRVVKCWYQAGIALTDTRHKTLTPELLLHDDDVVRVDYGRQVNILRNLGDIMDSRVLKPFTVPRRQNKQIWVTIRVPGNAAAAYYTGAIRISTPKRLAIIKIRLRVLPFGLSPPYYTSSIYYRGKIDPQGKGSISADMKSEAQLRSELKDMCDHGVTNPTVYQYFDKKLLGRYLRIRDELGMGGQPLYYLGFTTRNPTGQEDLEALKAQTRQLINFTKPFGIPEVFVYGMDEARGRKLESQRAAWQAVHEAGGKVFAAGRKKRDFVMADVLDLPYRCIKIEVRQPV